MKVSELSGALLDYWVAKCEGKQARTAEYTDSKWYCVVPAGTCGEQGWTDQAIYSPSSDWAQGGPIIEREKIIVGARQRMADSGRWTHLHWTGRAYQGSKYNDYAPGIPGDTALIAAMRAYVGSKFGAEVPDQVSA